MSTESVGAPSLEETERRQSSRLLIIVGLIACFFVFELIGARMAKSDVLEADAFHLLMDVFAIAISLAALRIASRKPSRRYTFGLRRAEPLTALLNGILVLGVAAELVRDAIEHLGETQVPKTGLMLIVATAALVVNGLNAWLLHGVMGHHGHSHGHGGHSHGHSGHSGHDHAAHSHVDAHDHAGHGPGHGHGHGETEHAHHHDEPAKPSNRPNAHDVHEHDHDHDAHGAVPHGHQLNMRGAWLHLIGDALGSVAAFGAGLAMRLGAPPIVDPLASFVVVAILVVGAVRLLRDAVMVLVDAAPAHLPVPDIEKALLAFDGIKAVVSLHVWTLGTGHDAITAHVRSPSTDPTLGARACEALRKKFTVEYVTVQVDFDG